MTATGLSDIAHTAIGDTLPLDTFASERDTVKVPVTNDVTMPTTLVLNQETGALETHPPLFTMWRFERTPDGWRRIA